MFSCPSFFFFFFNTVHSRKFPTDTMPYSGWGTMFPHNSLPHLCFKLKLGMGLPNPTGVEINSRFKRDTQAECHFPGLCGG